MMLYNMSSVYVNSSRSCNFLIEVRELSFFWEGSIQVAYYEQVYRVSPPLSRFSSSNPDSSYVFVSIIVPATDFYS